MTVLLAVLMPCLPGNAAAKPAHQTEEDERLAKAEELKKLHAQIEAMNKAIEADRAKHDSLANTVEDAERNIAEAQRQVREVSFKIKRQAIKVQLAREQQETTQHRLDDQKEALAQQVRAAYLLGSGGSAELLLSQDEPDRIGRLLMDYAYLTRARKRYIDGINAEMAQAAELTAKLQNELEELNDLQTQRRQALVDIENGSKQRLLAMEQLQGRLESEGEELKRLQGNEQELQNLLESLKRALAETPPPVSTSKPWSGKTGSMQWPLRGEILANYGDSKAGGRLQWKGIWIEAQEGAPVHASASGRVAYVGWLSSFGLIVVLEHGHGLFTLYGHNAAVGKAVGDSVDAGDVIASAGNTGGYEQPGLYFEVRKGTDPMDPREWLTR
jgi:septal ring factor EnvC (AmiA/AmiB activator)